MSRYHGITDTAANRIIAYHEEHRPSWRLRGHVGTLSSNRESLKIRDSRRAPRSQYRTIFASDLENLEVKVGARFVPWRTIKFTIERKGR